MAQAHSRRDLPSVTEGALWNRLLEPAGEVLTVQAARFFLRLEFNPDDHARMQQLAEKASEGALTSAEQDEIATYERVGNLLALLKSKARQRLKKASSSNGSKR